jgi:hypothetical protein
VCSRRNWPRSAPIAWGVSGRFFRRVPAPEPSDALVLRLPIRGLPGASHGCGSQGQSVARVLFRCNAPARCSLISATSGRLYNACGVLRGDSDSNRPAFRQFTLNRGMKPRAWPSICNLLLLARRKTPGGPFLRKEPHCFFLSADRPDGDPIRSSGRTGGVRPR